MGEFQHQDNEKKKRYEIRHEYDKCNRNKEEGMREKDKNIIKNKISYRKFKNIDDRGYNIINQSDRKDYKNQLDLKHKKTDWDILVEKSGKDNNLKLENIYKDVYDNTDANVLKKGFDEERKSI